MPFVIQFRKDNDVFYYSPKHIGKYVDLDNAFLYDNIYEALSVLEKERLADQSAGIEGWESVCLAADNLLHRMRLKNNSFLE